MYEEAETSPAGGAVESARAAVIGMLALSVVSGFIALAPIGFVGSVMTALHPLAAPYFLLVAWVTTSVMIGGVLRFNFRFRKSVLLRLLGTATVFGAVNGAFVVWWLLVVEGASSALFVPAGTLSAMVGAPLGFIFGAALHKPLQRLRQTIDRPTCTPGSSAFQAVSGGAASLSALVLVAGVAAMDPFVIGVAAVPFLFVAGGIVHRGRLLALARGDRPGHERVKAATVHVPDDLLPLHESVGTSPRHVLVCVEHPEAGPFREAPTRVAYARVD